MSGDRFIWKNNYQNGDIYQGEAIQGCVKDGYGEFFWASTGATYKGMWAKDRFHGKGKHIVPGESGYTYEGDFLNGERSGSGVCVFHNGRRYEGEWLADKMHGQGFLVSAAGIDDYVEYTGPFVNGERSGTNGVCRYANGNVYKGTWVNDKQNGYGELQLEEAFSTPGYKPQMGKPHIVSYKGEFLDNLPHGLGEFLYSDGGIYKGECKGFMRDGEGEHFTTEGGVYKGKFQDDCRHGKGVLRSKSGEYDGNWCNNMLEGHVTFRDTKGFSVAAGLVFYDGPCVKGGLTGDGVVAKYRDGSSYTGTMVAGKPNGLGVLEKKKMNIPGIGEVMLHYKGEFDGGVPKGRGDGIFTVVTPDSRPAPAQPLSAEAYGFFPSYNLSGQYTGMWAGGLPNGDGEWQWEEGKSYRGFVKAGLAHGLGVFKAPDVHYEGSFSHGLPDGNGKAHWKISKEVEKRYEGTWKEGYFEGEGTLTLRSGAVYSGGWKKGVKAGRGVEFQPNDYRYEGEFEEGKRHGQGTLCLKRKGVTYKGVFTSDEITGDGEMTLEDGTVMKGGFLRGEPHGTVEIRSTTGSIFKGEFERGVVNGPGVMEYPNGDKYKGGFINGEGPVPLRHGQGVYCFAEGHVLECTWKKNILHGRGIYRTKNGDQLLRLYTDGVLNEGSPRSSDALVSGSELSNTFPGEMSSERQIRQQNVGQRTVIIRQPAPQKNMVQINRQRDLGSRTLSVVDPKSYTESLSTSGTALTTAEVPNLTPSQIAQQTTLSPTAAKGGDCSSVISSIFKNTLANSVKGENREELGERNECSDFVPFLKSAEFSNVLPVLKKDMTVSSSSFSIKNEEQLQKAIDTQGNKEHEINSLTEKLRRLNEQIGQLSVSTSDTVLESVDDEPSTKMSRLSYLQCLHVNRQSIVRQLYCLLK